MTETPRDYTAAIDDSLHLEMLKLQFEPLAGIDGIGSSSPDTPVEADSKPVEEAEEQVQAVVVPSMSRHQTYMLSPTTPAAEKAAVLAEAGITGFFDRPLDSPLEEQEFIGNNHPVEHLSAQYDGAHTPPPRTPEDEMPSPWRASPKQFEHMEQPIGSLGMLADLNFKRYISNINLPMPKTPLFKDFSVPTLASVFGSVRDHSPLRKGTRPKRANTIDTRAGYPSSVTDGGARDHVVGPTEETTAHASLPFVEQYPADARQGRPGSTDIRTSQQYPRLHRTISDQSLLLRRAGSTKSSLGDDSRWAAVHEQVNSRRKAIMDSLQDSKFPRPSIPDMPSLNLAAFRPDFLRPRVESDVKLDRTRGSIHLNNKIESRNLKSNEASNSKSSPRAETADDTQAINKETQQMFSHFDRALESLTGDIVVMGGYRGSILRSAKPPHRQQWVPVKVGLNIRKVNLEIGLEPEDEENSEDTIIPGGMLSHIGPVDMGRRLLKRLGTCKNALDGKLRVHDYGYDWRLSPHLLSRKLIGFLEHLKSNAMDAPAEERGAFILAHSMGGLITRHAVNRRPELFAGVVYAGVPQHCVNILGPIRNGDDVLLSSKVLTAQVNFTMRSTFVLLPDDGLCFIDKETKEEYPVDFFDVEQWKEYAFSPCLAPIQPPISAEPKKGLFESLSNSLPSLPSFPLPNRRSSPTSHEPKPPSHPTPIHKLSNLIDSNPSTARALDPSFTQQSTHHPTNTTTIPFPSAYKYLSRTLNATVSFRSELHHLPALQHTNRYPPLACLYATNTPTVSRARVSSRSAIRCADAYDDLQFGSGDGVCLAKAAQLPEGYVAVKGGRVRTERGHVGLLGDLEGVGRCLGAVVRARRGGVGMGVGVGAAAEGGEANGMVERVGRV